MRRRQGRRIDAVIGSSKTGADKISATLDAGDKWFKLCTAHERSETSYSPEDMRWSHDICSAIIWNSHELCLHEARPA